MNITRPTLHTGRPSVNHRLLTKAQQAQREAETSASPGTSFAKGAAGGVGKEVVVSKLTGGEIKASSLAKNAAAGGLISTAVDLATSGVKSVGDLIHTASNCTEFQGNYKPDLSDPGVRAEVTRLAQNDVDLGRGELKGRPDGKYNFTPETYKNLGVSAPPIVLSSSEVDRQEANYEAEAQRYRDEAGW